MIRIYKLKYIDRETAIADLIAKGVINENGEYINGTQAVVEIGLIVLEHGTYDENCNEITPPVYADGYHYDIMTSDEIEFGNAVTPNHPKHTFSGY